MARVLLVQPQSNYTRSFAEAPSTALLILGTLAKKLGHEVQILHLDIDHIDAATACRLFKPDIVGMTVNTLQVKSARLVALGVRKVSRDIKRVVGGPHASLWDGEADEVVIGEGENRWLDLLGAGYQIRSIDDVPQLDYSLVDLSKFCGFEPMYLTPAVAVMGSRGCPFHCVFCNTPLFWGNKVRFRSPELVVDEVESLANDYGMKEVTFQDDTFNLNHEWAMEIFERIIKKGLNKKMLFRLTSRVDTKLVTKEFLDLAHRAGVWYIFYGVESGSQYMLDRMKKGITVAEIKRAIQMTREAHIFSYCSFIVGLPGETKDTLSETEKLISEVQPTNYNWSFACPFPNTEFDKEVTAKEQKLCLDFGEYGYGKLMARTDELSFEDLASFRGFNTKGARKMDSWAEFYERVCGNKKLLEGNIMEHSYLVWTISRFVAPGDKVLEIGSGTGVMGFPLAQAGIKVVSIDNDPQILKMALINAGVLGADIEYREADAFHLPFLDREFKVAFSEGLVEHYSDEDIAKLVAEHQRVSDIVVVSVPLKGSSNISYGNERWMTMEEWEAIFKPMGACEGSIYGHEPNGCFTFKRRDT